MINRVIFVAVVLCIAMIGQAVAEIVDGNKLFADCRDGDDPSARDRTTSGELVLGMLRGWQTHWSQPVCIARQAGRRQEM